MVHRKASPCDTGAVVGLIRCCRASDRQGDFSLCLQLGGINRVGIQIQYRRHLRVAEKLLNCFYVLSPADQESRKRMTEVVESESLISLQPDSGFDGGGRISITFWRVCFGS